MTDLASVDFDFNGATFRVQGADYFYGDRGVTDTIGADITDDNDLGGKVVITDARSYKRVLPKLTAIMKKSGIADIGSSAQSDNTRYYDFFCNPSNVAEALENLPGTDVDANLLPGDWKIQRVVIAGSGGC
ncbi:MAG: hypothetical protein AAGC93_26355 [Cyanobacteria bacterium P01_F01_bin.53]